jgi:hypothetical protein
VKSFRHGSVSGGLLTRGNAKEATFHAVITRADGSVEDLGQIAYWHKNPVRRWLWSARKYLSMMEPFNGRSRPE